MQNSFSYSDGLFVLDYTDIPASWTLGLIAIAKVLLPPEVAQKLVNSFVLGGQSMHINKRFGKEISTKYCQN